MEPVCCSMSSSNCCFLPCIHVSQEAGQVVWCSHLFQNFPQFIVIHTVKYSFGIVNKAEIDAFLELSCFFHDPSDVGNLISGSSAFSKTIMNIWKFTVHVLLRLILCPKYPGLPPWGLGCEATRESSGWGLGPSPSAAPGRLFSISEGSLYLLCPHRQHRLPGSMSSHLVVASLASPPTVSLFHLPVHSPHFIQRGLWYKWPLPRLKHLWPPAPLRTDSRLTTMVSEALGDLMLAHLHSFIFLPIFPSQIPARSPRLFLTPAATDTPSLHSD